MRRKQSLTTIILLFISVVLIIGASSSSVVNPAQENGTKKVGLAEGQPAPHFQTSDQFGKEQTDASIAGRKGTVLLFFRSADW